MATLVQEITKMAQTAVKEQEESLKEVKTARDKLKHAGVNTTRLDIKINDAMRKLEQLKRIS